MLPAFLAISLLSSSPPAASPVAALRVEGDKTSFMVKVTEDISVGYQITIDCTEHCTRVIHYRETTSDTPLGIFSRDQNGLIFSTWSGGSTYRVVVWSVSDNDVQRVTELSSRARPDFMSGPDGTPVIQTYEADTAAAPLHRIRWIFANGRFVQSRPNGC